MTVSHTVANATSIDWTVVAGALATFITTAFLTWQGVKKGREKVAEKAHIQEETGGSIAIRGGVLMDNMTMTLLSTQLHENHEAAQDLTRAIEQNTAMQLKMWEQLVELKMETRAVIHRLSNR